MLGIFLINGVLCSNKGEQDEGRDSPSFEAEGEFFLV